MSGERIKVIVCGGNTGRAVIYCEVSEVPIPGDVVVMHNARMVLQWASECGGIFGLATSGPKGTTRLTAPVAEVRDTCRQVLAVSDNAAAAFDAWPSV